MIFRDPFVLQMKVRLAGSKFGSMTERAAGNPGTSGDLGDGTTKETDDITQMGMHHEDPVGE